MNVLFLCTANKNRSKTAEDYFNQVFPNHQFLSAGLNQHMCQQEGTTLATEQMLEWADKIFVMETRHQNRIKEYTGEKYLGKVINLKIEDKYQYMQSDLVEVLKMKVECFLDT